MPGTVHALRNSFFIPDFVTLNQTGSIKCGLIKLVAVPVCDEGTDTGFL